MKKSMYQLEALSCPSCLEKIQKAINNQSGISNSKVLFNSAKVVVEYDGEQQSEQSLGNVITNLGYSVLSSKTKEI